MGSYKQQGEYGFNSECEGETMEDFEQQSDKPDLHILEQPLVPISLLSLSILLLGTHSWCETRSLKELDPAGNVWAGVNMGCGPDTNERKSYRRVWRIQTKAQL